VPDDRDGGGGLRRLKDRLTGRVDERDETVEDRDAPARPRARNPTTGSHMPIPTLEFGSTGHRSTRLIFGGASLAAVSQDVADRVLDLLLQHGVNHIDVAASYGDAELRVAPWLRTHRDEFFLATKTGERTADAAYEEAAALARAARRGPRSTCGSCTTWPTRSTGTSRSARRGGRGRDPGQGGGPGPVRRRHRPRRPDRREPPPQPGAVRVRLGAAARTTG
jgi:hypothetical protein